MDWTPLDGAIESETASSAARRPYRDLPHLLDERLRAGSGQVWFYRRADDGFVAQPRVRLLGRVAAFAEQLRAAGVDPGQIVLVACPAPEAALVAFLGAVTARVVPTIVPIRPAFDGTAAVIARLNRLVDELPDVGAVIIQRGANDELASHLTPRCLTLDVDALPLEDMPPPSTVDPDSVAYLQLTSGTTSRSKAAVMTHRAVLANLNAITDRFEIGRDETFLSWLPLYHDMGLAGFPLLALLADADLALMTPFDFLSDPSRWLRGLAQVNATMSASPTFGFDYTTRKARDTRLVGVDLSGLTRLYCGAEPVDAETLRRFHTRFAPLGLRADVLRATYGMAEATLMVTMPHMRETGRVVSIEPAVLATLDTVDVMSSRQLLQPAPASDAIDIVSVGRPAAGLELRLEDETGNPIHEDLRCGEIVVTGESVSPGYLRADGSLEPIAPSGLRTGDIGFVDRGEWYIIERTKNLIIRNGQNHSARVLEDRICSITGTRPDCVVVFDSDIRPGAGRVTAAIELDRNDSGNDRLEALRARLSEFDPPLDDVVLLRAGGLPRTTSGKKRPVELRQRLGAGTLKIVATETLTPRGFDAAEPAVVDLVAIEIADEVRAAVEEHARRRGVIVQIDDDSHFASDLGFDSLAMYELAMTIEDRASIELPERALASVDVVADLCALAATQRRAPSSDAGITRSLAAAAEDMPQVLNTVQAQHGRQVLVGGRWVSDFASCNYLGLDLHPEVIEAVEPAIRAWGVHPSWTRAVASPEPYRELEHRLAGLVGAPDTVVFPTVTLLHMGVLPTLAGPAGTIVLDRAAHRSIHQASDLSRAQGTTVREFEHGDLGALASALAASADSGPTIVALDGVYSMEGSYSPLPEILRLAERHDATVYVDDAHGFGMLGEDPSPELPMGRRGNGIARFHDLGYDRLVYVAGMSKAFSSMAAFVTVRDQAERRTIETSPTMVFSGPIPVASLATVLAGLDVNDAEGDRLRSVAWDLTARLVEGVRDLGFELDNRTGFPIVNVIVGDPDAVHRACNILWDAAVLVTPAIFPAMPMHRGGVRFTLTAANTTHEVDKAIAALTRVRAALGLPERA